MSKQLTFEQQKELAREFDFRLPQTLAVIAVESRGEGFIPNDPDNRPKILYERHIFHRLTEGIFSKEHPELSNRKTFGRDKKLPREERYLGGTAEWERLARAIKLNRSAALQSCSWGIGQVMGMHFNRLGYNRVQDFVNDAYESEAKQAMHMLRYLSLDKRMVEVMKKENCTLDDFRVLARLYNGPNFETDGYHIKLHTEYIKNRT